MSNTWCLDFVRKSLVYWPENSDVLDVGSLDVNGQNRDIAMLRARSYVGVDIQPGKNVDQILPAERLIEFYGPEKFDVVVSTEMLEHCADWRTPIYNMLFVTKVEGILVLTTRSEGFPFHEYPIDRWRFSVGDLRRIFYGACELLHQEKDTPESPGAGIVVRRKAAYLDKWKLDLQDMQMHDIRNEV